MFRKEAKEAGFSSETGARTRAGSAEHNSDISVYMFLCYITFIASLKFMSMFLDWQTLKREVFKNGTQWDPSFLIQSRSTLRNT